MPQTTKLPAEYPVLMLKLPTLREVTPQELATVYRPVFFRASGPELHLITSSLVLILEEIQEEQLRRRLAPLN